MVLREYLIIFPSKVCRKGKSSSIFALKKKKKRSLSLSHSQICGSPSLLRSWFHSLRLVGPWLAILDSLFFTLSYCVAICGFRSRVLSFVFGFLKSIRKYGLSFCVWGWKSEFEFCFCIWFQSIIKYCWISMFCKSVGMSLYFAYLSDFMGLVAKNMQEQRRRKSWFLNFLGGKL